MIVDITGVTLVDTQVANALIQALLAANGITEALAAVTAAVKQAVDGLAASGCESSTKVEHIDID